MRVPQEPGRQAGTPGTFASADGTTRKTRGGCGVPATNWSPADTMIGTHIAGEKKHTRYGSFAVDASLWSPSSV